MRRSVFICGILLTVIPSIAGLTCRGKCGSVLEVCSCHPSCVTLMSCCADYNQSCFQLAPHSSCMLGGRALRVLGLVLQPGSQLLCRFKGEIERAGLVDAEGQAYCVSPLLYETGWMTLDISTDGKHFDRSAEFLSVHPSKADRVFEVALVNATQWQYYGTPNVAGRLKMTWNSSVVRADRVNVELWGYREVDGGDATGANGSSSLRAELSYLYSVARNLPNSGGFSFIPEPKAGYSQWELGNIRITSIAEADGAKDVEALWSAAHVLAWHLEQPFRDDSSAWARHKCLQWDVLENKAPDFLSELADCPCTLAQARADRGRFHTDYSCNIESGSVCTYHPGSAHCVRAIQASPVHGSGQQCCYERTGALLMTGDSAGGGTPDRAHDRGSPPYGEPPRVPGYSHWLYDVRSFYYCCLWSDNCQIYLKQRPSSDCRKYQPPKTGVVFGDPHFITFDGLQYTFNGRGEYHLVSSPHRELSVQARTEQVKLDDGSLVKATRLSSVAMKEKASDVMEVRLADGRLQVLRNQKVLPFTEQRWMDLQGAFVFVPGPENVTVSFSSGAGVEVRLHEGTMAATVLLPVEFSNRTQGLLGVMNSDQSDDLTTQSGAVVSADAPPEEIFTFGGGWSISNKSSLFTYDSEHLLDLYVHSRHDAAFVPDFSLPERPDDPLVSDMLAMCSGEGANFCKYDTLAARSLSFGNATLRAYQRYQALMTALQPVVSCGWLPTPKNGKKNGTGYLQGTTLSFSCDEGFARHGPTERTCLRDGTWTGEQPQCVTDDVVGLVLGVVGSISVLITMAVMVKLHISERSRERKKNPDQTETRGQMSLLTP